ncbi:hypothetical protein [Cobetia sp. QF-1]|uniref:ApeP family dehydratase n=1 Tax=Cobetia sp. QF-1 TaxID=1969833 RepID=UPI001594F520|nr:hypothetical protein [Cobetia sp. QF-1]
MLTSPSDSWPTLPCDIGPYVPHEMGMCLLDRILACDDTSLSADICPTADDLFAEPDADGQSVIPGWVGLEWMAQAIAAWSGMQAARSGQPPRVGFLLGSRRFNSEVAAFACAHRWQIHVQLDYRANNGLGAFTAQISDDNGIRVANAGVNVFEPSDAADSSTDSSTNNDSNAPLSSPGQQDAAGASLQGNS